METYHLVSAGNKATGARQNGGGNGGRGGGGGQKNPFISNTSLSANAVYPHTMQDQTFAQQVGLRKERPEAVTVLSLDKLAAETLHRTDLTPWAKAELLANNLQRFLLLRPQAFPEENPVPPLSAIPIDQTHTYKNIQNYKEPLPPKRPRGRPKKTAVAPQLGTENVQASLESAAVSLAPVVGVPAETTGVSNGDVNNLFKQAGNELQASLIPSTSSTATATALSKPPPNRSSTTRKSRRPNIWPSNFTVEDNDEYVSANDQQTTDDSDTDGTKGQKKKTSKGQTGQGTGTLTLGSWIVI